jgi:periplasmic divalent cation tolerance protein
MTTDSRHYGVVLVTTASQEEAEAIASALIEEQLAACVSLFPIKSIYRWQGEIQRDSEWQLLIKTDLAQFSHLAIRIQSLHSYDVPEIIALAIVAGSDAYLAYLDSVLNTKSS